jgi:Big-like domain-containing protein
MKSETARSLKRIAPGTFFLISGLIAPAIGLLMSCGGGDIGQPQPRQLVSVSVQPSSATATQGSSVPFSATGTFNQAPATQTNLPAQWASSDTNIATIDANTGAATCVSIGGPVTISASAAGKGGMVNGSATLTCQVSPDPMVTLNPTKLNFLCGLKTTPQGQICSCEAPGGNTVTLTNTGGATLDISQILAGPQVFNDRIGQNNTCGSSVGAGQSCTISVDATWWGNGSFGGGVSIYDHAADSPQSVSVFGITTCL